MCVGHDDLYKKKPRYNPHAHDPMARTWANDFNNLALDARYEKTAAPFSKRRNSTHQPVDRSRGGFYGLGQAQPIGNLSTGTVGTGVLLLAVAVLLLR